MSPYRENGSKGNNDSLDGQEQKREELQAKAAAMNLNYIEDDENTKNKYSDNLLSLSFNQDGGCLAVGTTSGFRIYNVYPFQENFRRTFDSSGDENVESNEDDNNNDNLGGIGLAEMLFRCNLLALVGGGPSPRYPPNKVMIWDDHRGRCIGELSFRQRVLSVRLRRDRVAVALMDRIYVYNFSDLTLLDQIHTVNNPLGLLSLSSDIGGLSSPSSVNTSSASMGMVLACPSIARGGVRVELYGCRKTLLIDAHETSLSALSLSIDGAILATSSEKGTLIRIFSTKDKNGSLLKELRRGVERAKISCIAFSLDKRWLAATSDRGTAHVFSLTNSQQSKTQQNNMVNNRNNSSPTRTSKISQSNQDAGKGNPGISSILTSPKKYLQSKRILWDGEGSYAQIRGINDPVVCAFLPDRPMTVAIVGKADGSILLADFSKGGGEAERVAYHRFIQSNVKEHDSDINNGENVTGGDVIFGDDESGDGFVTVDREEGGLIQVDESVNNS